MVNCIKQLVDLIKNRWNQLVLDLIQLIYQIRLTLKTLINNFNQKMIENSWIVIENRQILIKIRPF